MPDEATFPEVVVVGAGLAGLACAARLAREGIACRVLEASDGVGGRVRTDTLDGFLLDRGFQVLLTAYPEVREQLDLAALDLHRFIPGALVHVDGELHEAVDPLRDPARGLRTALSPVGTVADKARLVKLWGRLKGEPLEAIWGRPETTTLARLREEGFSDVIIERFFRPFFAGVLLDPELRPSSRLFEFLFRIFADGDTCLPARGMGAVPQQLATALPPDTLKLRCGVAAVAADDGGARLRLMSGEDLRARAVVVAVDGPTAARLLGEVAEPPGVGSTTLYFDAPRAPVEQPILVLDGERGGAFNNVCVPSQVAPSYAPEGRALVAVQTVGVPSASDRELERGVRQQLVDWFGEAPTTWRHLRTYRIAHAHPRQAPGELGEVHRPVRLRRGLYVCGDHRDSATLNGALLSGRRAAEAALDEILDH